MSGVTEHPLPIVRDSSVRVEFSSQAMSQLKEFGVTTYGARAYLALLELGVAEARGVSELANIPSAKVYGALVQLQRRGLAEVTPGKPRKYAPVPIQDFVERQLQQQEDQSAVLRARMAEITELFPVKGDVAVMERPQTVTIEGKRNIMQHLREACQGATGSIHALMSPMLRADLTLRRPFEEAARRGVAVEIIEDPSPPDLAGFAATFGGPAALGAPAGPAASFVATFDDRAALLVRFARGRRKDGQESAAIHTTDPGFVAPLRHLLVFHGALRRRVVADPAGGSPAEAEARLDAQTFARLVDEHARSTPASSCALLHAADAEPSSRTGCGSPRAAQRRRASC